MQLSNAENRVTEIYIVGSYIQQQTVHTVLSNIVESHYLYDMEHRGESSSEDVREQGL